jgi:transposase InsO family protein
MTVKMNKTIEQERYSWIKPIINKELKYNEVLLTCPHSKRSLERWVSLYKKHGIEGLVPKSTEPKTQKKETGIEIKERVIELRKETGFCALKLKWRLEKEGIYIHQRTIGKILKKEGLVRKYRKKKIKYKYIKAERQPGELVEIDVKYVPGKLKNKRYYQYTAIDTASRWRYLRIFEEQSNYHSVLFLEDLIQRFPYKIQAIKTDNGFVFTNRYTGTYKRQDLSPRTLHALDKCCAKYKIIHYLIDPGKPAQNGTVERSHREDEEKFYQRNKFKSVNDLKTKICQWNDYYNNLEHCSLDGKTPNEVLLSYSPEVRT